MPPQAQGSAWDLGQTGSRKPASDKGVWSFPQAFALIWKVGSRKRYKIQHVVVFS
jgi:hypothetical protein